MTIMYLVLFLTSVHISLCLSAASKTSLKNETDSSKSVYLAKNWSKNDGHTQNSSKLDANQSKSFHSKSSNDSKAAKVFSRSKHKNDTHQEIYSHSVMNATQRPAFIFHKIHRVVTRSKDAVWATLSLTFICVILVLAVAQSRMWKDRRTSYESQGVPLPNFNERVLFKDVMERKIHTVKEFFTKKKEKKRVELQSLLTEEWDED